MKTILRDYYEAHPERFVETMEHFRQVRKISVGEFNKLLSLHGVSAVTARRWRREGPPFERTTLIAQILGVKVEYLILRHDFGEEITPEQADLNRLWGFLDPDARLKILDLVRLVATRSPDYTFS